MKRLVITALLTLALAGGSLPVAAPAMAQVNVGVDVGGIAFGYTDGYWDRDHHWHAWRNRREAAEWRAQNRDHYYAMRHDRVDGHGWREERYWDHH
jgi:hypothetical protein